MAGQAAGPVVGHALGGANVVMRVVAGSAAELLFAAAGLITSALVHLFDVRYRRPLFAGPADIYEHRKEISQRQTRAEVVPFSALRQHAHPLRWHCSQTASERRGRQFRGIDDVQLLHRLDVPPAWSVTAFAADHVAVKDRLLVAVFVSLLHSCPVGVAEQTIGLHGPACNSAGVKAGRQIPDLLLREPADRSLEEITLPQIGQVGVSPRPEPMA